MLYIFFPNTNDNSVILGILFNVPQEWRMNLQES